MFIKIKYAFLISAIFLFSATLLWASGKCPKCLKTWNQPWAKDFKICPECGTPLVQIEKKLDTDSETVQEISISRVDKQFSNIYRRRLALCIGINNYIHFPVLEYAVSDAQSMAGIMKGYGFDDICLLTDERATKKKIVNELLRFKAESEEGDLFVFYFAGHGTALRDLMGKENGYLIPADCNDENMIDKVGISMSLFKDICETMPNKHILFLVDCCYSGYGLTRSIIIHGISPSDDPDNYLTVITGTRAAQLLTAGGKNDLAHERDGHGIFTSYLLEVLEGKTSHKDDGIISVLEMSSYIKQKVIEQTRGRQNPAFGYLLGNGDVAFITGKQDRKILERQSLLSIAEIDELCLTAGSLERQGDYLNAERKFSLAFSHFKRYQQRDENKELYFLKRLASLSNNMQKNDMAIYYGREILEFTQEHLEHAFAYNQIGKALTNKGDYDEAIDHFEKSLRILIEKFGLEHPDIAAIYNNLGETYVKNGDYGKAIYYFQKALKISIKELGINHPVVASSYSHLAGAFGYKGEYTQSINYYEKALNILTEKVGAEHPDVAEVYNNLGGIYLQDGNPDKAIDYFQRALRIGVQQLGDDHPEVAASYNNLGGAFSYKNDYARGIEYYEKSLKIILKKLGPDHPYIATMFNNIGLAYYNKGDDDLAIEYYQKALDIDIEKLGPKHPNVATNYSNLGAVLIRKGNYDRAIEYYQKALDIDIDKLGPGHPDIATDYNNLGSAYDGKGDRDQANRYYKKALDVGRKQFREKSRDH